ncbi:MAG: SET domain-containing protein [Bacteroidia bacterium]
MDHLISIPEEDYLYVQTSLISNAGLGLFTAIDIYKDEIIAEFKGEVLSQKQANLRVLNRVDQYFMNLPNGSIFDTSLVKGFAKYANDAEGLGLSNFRNNAKIQMEGLNKICLVAKRKIKAGEEIFCSYGKLYWKKHRPI